MEYILGSGLLGSFALVAWLTYEALSARKETGNVRDLYENQREVAEQYKSERDVAVAAGASKDELLKVATERLAVAEKQRNEAYERATSALVDHVRSGSAADGGALVERLLALPIVPAGDHASANGGVTAETSLHLAATAAPSSPGGHSER